MITPESPACHVVGLTGLPEIEPGDDLVRLTAEAVERIRLAPEPGDVFIYTQKIVSKAEGCLVRLDDVSPSSIASEWGQRWQRDPRVIELVLRESARVVRMERGVVITQTRHGFVCANGGVDTSNVAPGWAALLPADPDASARRLSAGLRAIWNVPIAVIVSDTFGRPWREGQTNVAIGAAGMRPIVDYRGGLDVHGQPLRSTAIAIADELAAAAELVMGKTRGIPIAVVKGSGVAITAVDEASARDLVRCPEGDMFR